MYKIKLLSITLITFVMVGQLHAQRRWGVGLTGGYNLPIAGYNNWYTGTGLFGGKLIFQSSSNSELEIEYNYSNFSNSSMAERMFSSKSQIKYAYLLNEEGEAVFIIDADGKHIPFAEVDENKYPKAKGRTVDSLYSSEGSSRMTVHSITVNTVKYFERNNFLNSRFFLTGGVGFHIYKHQVDSLLYGGKPIDSKGNKIFLEPFEDSRVALGFNIGGGLDAKISEHITLDIRTRYHVFVGELRPMEAYKYKGEGFASEDKTIDVLEKVFPIQYITFSASIKYFF